MTPEEESARFKELVAEVKRLSDQLDKAQRMLALANREVERAKARVKEEQFLRAMDLLAQGAEEETA